MDGAIAVEKTSRNNNYSTQQQIEIEKERPKRKKTENENKKQKTEMSAEKQIPWKGARIQDKKFGKFSERRYKKIKEDFLASKVLIPGKFMEKSICACPHAVYFPNQVVERAQNEKNRIDEKDWPRCQDILLDADHWKKSMTNY